MDDGLLFHLKPQNLSGFSLISFMSLATTIGVNIISSSRLKLTSTYKFDDKEQWVMEQATCFDNFLAN